MEIVLFVVAMLASAAAGVSSNYLDEAWGVAVLPVSVVIGVVAAGINFVRGAND